MKAEASLGGRFDELQCGVEPAAQSAVCMVSVNLVRGAFSERHQETDHASWIGQVICWLGEGTLEVQQAFASEETYHLS